MANDQKTQLWKHLLTAFSLKRIGFATIHTYIYNRIVSDLCIAVIALYIKCSIFQRTDNAKWISDFSSNII